jgi:hypothetical protein
LNDARKAGVGLRQPQPQSQPRDQRQAQHQVQHQVGSPAARGGGIGQQPQHEDHDDNDGYDNDDGDDDNAAAADSGDDGGNRDDDDDDDDDDAAAIAANGVVPVYTYTLSSEDHQAFAIEHIPSGNEAIINRHHIHDKFLLPKAKWLLIRKDLAPFVFTKGPRSSFMIHANAKNNQKFAILALDEYNQVKLYSLIPHLRCRVGLQLHVFALCAGTAGTPIGYQPLYKQVQLYHTSWYHISMSDNGLNIISPVSVNRSCSSC